MSTLSQTIILCCLLLLIESLLNNYETAPTTINFTNFFLKNENSAAERFKRENVLNLRQMTKKERKQDPNSMFMMPSPEFKLPIFPRHPYHRILLELKSKLERVLPPTFQPSSSTDIVQYLLGRVEHQLFKTVPDISGIRKLIDDVNFHLDVPDWWEDVHLCFRFYADAKKHGERNCGGGVSPSCVSPNHYTFLFSDKSNGKSRGCHLSWGLFLVPQHPNIIQNSKNTNFSNESEEVVKNNTNNRDTANKNIKDIYYNHDKRRDKKILHIPDWFKNVLLCFKFYAPSPENHSPPGNATCAGLNEYTPYYHDRYGYQKRFVAMSWAIMYPEYNPENSNPVIPAWALENRICLSHYRQVVIPLLWYTTVRKQKCSSLNEYSYNYLDGSFYKSLFKNTKNYIQWALVNSFTFPTAN